MRMLSRGPRGLDVVVARWKWRLLVGVARSLVCSIPGRHIPLLFVKELLQVCLVSGVLFRFDIFL